MKYWICATSTTRESGSKVKQGRDSDITGPPTLGQDGPAIQVIGSHRRDWVDIRSKIIHAIGLCNFRSASFESSVREVITLQNP